MKVNSNMMSSMDTLEQTSRRKNIEKTGAVNGQSNTTSTIGQDIADISEKGKDVSSMTTALKELPDVRTDRVAELKAKIASGSYNVSGRDIAEKIVNSALEDVF